MKTRVVNRTHLMLILATVLIVLGIQGTSYGQTITASVQQSLTEANLHGSVVTLALTGGTYESSSFRIERAVSFSGIDGVTVATFFGVKRVSDTVVTIELEFDGNIDADGTLTFTVGAGAIAGYSGNVLTASLPVTAVEESLDASTESPLTEATLHGSIITLTLSGRRFADRVWDIEDAVSLSGIDGAAVSDRYLGVERVSDTVVTVPLTFSGNIDEDTPLTLTIGADAIAGYNQAFTVQLPVTAVEESLEASTEVPLTEANLDGSIITLSLNGRQFTDRVWDIGDALSFSGIDGATVGRFAVHRVSDTEAAVELTFSGNIDEDATLTLTVGADAISGYDKSFTFQFPVTAVEESLEASTEAPLTEANLDGSIITLSLNGRRFAGTFGIGYAVSVSGIGGVTFDDLHDVDRVSDTEVTIELEFTGNIDTDATLTFNIGAEAIAGYNQAFTVQLPVTAVEESLEATTEAPLTETMLDGGTITLTLTGRRFAGWTDIEDAVSVSGIDGVDIGWRDQDVVVRDLPGDVVSQTVVGVSDTEVIMELEFAGNIDTDATLTLTVGPDAIVGGYDKDFTFEFPVTAIEESLTASTEAPLTEANLDGSIITLRLNGRSFADGFADGWTREDAVSFSGIDGVTFDWYVVRVSDTEIAVKLEFDGTDFDTDTTVTFTVAARAANHNQDLTAQIPVTAIQQSNATVSITPSPLVSPNVGEQLTFNLNIAGGENVAGYQATVLYDPTALRLVDAINGDYLPADAFFLEDRLYDRLWGVRLTANTLAEASNGDGTLATLMFEVVDFKPSTVTLSQVYLVDADGKRWEATTESAEVTIPPEPAEAIFGDINRDGVVNIQDLAIVGTRLGQRGQNSADINEDGLVDVVDIVLVASAFDAAAAPTLYPQAVALMTAADVRQWLHQAQVLNLTDATFQSGIRFLEQLLTALSPKETTLLPNYPNPFNPETWIPYWLAEDAFVTLTIYDQSGGVVRTLDVGHRVAAFYESRSQAIHWNGSNEFGEGVASGVYFYHLSAGSYSATRKMLIIK